MGNNPANMVEVVAEKDVCICTTAGQISIRKGEAVMMKKSDYARCLEPLVLQAEISCPDMTWLITIPAGEAWKAEVPIRPDGSKPNTVCSESCECLLLAVGTPTAPLIVPEGAEIKENPPALLQTGTNTQTLLDEHGELADAIAYVNSSANDAQVEITWKGCS